MTSKSLESETVSRATPSQWIRFVLVYLLIPLVLMLCGGDLKWLQGWIYSALLFVPSIILHIWVERRHPGMLTERANSGRAQDIKDWDRVLSRLMALSISFPVVIVAGLDHRYGWSPEFPGWLNVLGFLIVITGFFIGGWAFLENRFFSGVVRIQTERGHTVCESGPYAIVRHPGYAGNLLAVGGMALAVSSLWTLVPAAVAFVIIILRTTLEDRTLREELPGYQEYAQRVHFCLFPGIC